MPVGILNFGGKSRDFLLDNEQLLIRRYFIFSLRVIMLKINAIIKF